MTGPVTTEALDYVRDLIRQSIKVGAPGLAEPVREALVRSIFLKIDGKVIQPLLSDKAAALAAHQQVTAERDEANGTLRYCEGQWQDERGVMLAELARLRAEGEVLREDAARLDFLDGCNARLNASYGTHYGWKLVLNHNVNRLLLGDMKVDLHDSEGGNEKLPSCRLAIDEARKRTALARTATAREGA
ncbi:hypothetical protein [Methylorubrum zatmanii]|uniref:Uncharacterized protein n=1 Tax=Methylorubrum zatmanii TaxID=29429 RepID=A0ABW1WTW4_9HYPH|nr:hypothetical protein [Methylorubrum zatmanii]MBD8909684.1 hypothetical protein [Methylorubrum zatmanii]